MRSAPRVRVAPGPGFSLALIAPPEPAAEPTHSPNHGPAACASAYLFLGWARTGAAAWTRAARITERTTDLGFTQGLAGRGCRRAAGRRRQRARRRRLRAHGRPELRPHAL